MEENFDDSLCLVVSNLAHAATEDDLETIFCDFNTQKCIVREQGSECVGFVFFGTAEEALKAEKLDRTFYDSRRIRVRTIDDYEKFQKEEEQRGKMGRGGEGWTGRPVKRRKYDNHRRDLTNLYVCPIPAGVNEQDLRNIFQSFGPIKKVTILRNHRGGEQKGGKPGFVDFCTNETARRCITAMNGRKVKDFFPQAAPDRTLIIRFSDRESDRPPPHHRGRGPNHGFSGRGRGQHHVQQNRQQNSQGRDLAVKQSNLQHTYRPEPLPVVVNQQMEKQIKELQKENAYLKELLEFEKNKVQGVKDKQNQIDLCENCLARNHHLLPSDYVQRRLQKTLLQTSTERSGDRSRSRRRRSRTRRSRRSKDSRDRSRSRRSYKDYG